MRPFDETSTARFSPLFDAGGCHGLQLELQVGRMETRVEGRKLRGDFTVPSGVNWTSGHVQIPGRIDLTRFKVRLKRETTGKVRSGSCLQGFSKMI